MLIIIFPMIKEKSAGLSPLRVNIHAQLSSKLPSRYFPLIGFGEESGICSDKVLVFYRLKFPIKSTGLFLVRVFTIK